MKMYSDDAVTKAELHQVATTADINTQAVDEKQTKQIKQLRLWLAGTFVANLVFTVGFCLWHCTRM